MFRCAALIVWVVCTVVACTGAETRREEAEAAARSVRSLIERGDYVAAERAARDHADAVSRATGEHSRESIAAIDLVVAALVANGKGPLEEAGRLSALALARRQEWLGARHPDLVFTLRNRSQVIGDLSNVEAVDLLTRALAIQEAAATAPPLDVAQTLNLLSRALERTDRIDEAIQAAERSVEITSGQQDARAQARSLEVLVWALQAKGEYNAAGDRLARALELRRPRDLAHPEFVETLSLLSYQEFARGRFQEAHRAASDALSTAQQAFRPDHPSIARTMRLLAGAARDLWDLDRAGELLQQALAMAERGLGPSHPEIAAYLNNLASLTLLLGDYETARGLYDRSLAIRQAAFGEQHESVATVVFNLALVDASLGDFEAARREYQRALTIWEHIYGPDHAFVARALAAQAVVVRALDRPSDALPLFERALAIQEGRLGAQHRSVAISLKEVAGTLRQLHRDAEASRSIERALRIWTAAGAPDDPEYAEALALAADIRAERGNLAEAVRTYDRAVAIYERVSGSNHPGVTQVRMGLARTMARTARKKTALELADGAEEVGREHLRLMLRSLPERQALNYAGVRPRGVDLMLSLVGVTPGAEPEAIDAVIRSRALVLDEVAARRRGVTERTASGGEDALAVTLSSAQKRLGNLVVKGPGSMPLARYDQLVEAARRDSEQAERRLTAASADFRLERSRAQAGLDAVGSALPPRTALVSFVRYQQLSMGASPKAPAGDHKVPSGETPSYLAFVLIHGRQPVAIKLGSAASIETLVSTWRADIAAAAFRQPTAASRSSSGEAGVAIRRRIWDPIAPLVAGTRTIFVVPDGALSLVPFAALPVDGGYLIDTAPPLHYLTAERDLVALATPPAASAGGMLALGGPAFDDATTPTVPSAPSPPPSLRGAATTLDVAASPCGSFQSIRFQPLDGTLQEVREVATLWPDALGPPETRVGREAGEQAFKRDAPRYRVLHLATHGFFLDGTCLPASSATTTRGVGGLAVAATNGSPLRLSGLALAGANRRAQARADEDDGILTAEEVSSLDLHGVEWAVLSACDTGVGEIKAGEGVFGLRRAFQVAGARTVVMSLWSVEDQATRAWMRALYEGRFQRKLSTADAVHQASLTVLRDRRAKGLSTHPFFWAAFVAAGDWR